MDTRINPWGPDDQRGGANHLTEDVVLSALALARRGRTFDLSQRISPQSPRMPVVQSPYSLCMWSHPLVSRHSIERDRGACNGIGFADERVEMDLHTGTHIDALGHCSDGDVMYNGIPILEAVGNWGLKKLGIENLPPIVTRGILLDVPKAIGRELEPGAPLTPEDLATALGFTGTKMRPGDVVLVRTGWGRYYGVDNQRYLGPAPGIGLDAARWLSQRPIVAVGSDTMVLEVTPSESSEAYSPVHQHLLAQAGVYIIENAWLEEIAEEGVYEFLCLCLAPTFQGATAAPIRLVAVA